MQGQFWMVYGLNQGQPTVRHKSVESARKEAARLARTCPGVKFYVMEAISMAERVDVRQIDLRHGYEIAPADDFEIPF
jgi:hypothetical protein